MRILALDCSTEWLSVAVSDGASLREHREHAVRSHSERALPVARELLDRAGLALADLDGIAFGAGPGAFTGIRIACGVAQGLSLGASLHVVGVSTLEALSEEALSLHGATRVCACLDARMGEVYVATYVRESDYWREIEPARVIKPVQIKAMSDGFFGAGDGFATYPQLATQLALRAHDATLLPSAAAIARLAAPRLQAGEGVPAERALPIYVRHRVALTSAERAAGEVL
ncbi:MAG TPA: tRNA (adenosine(37)-N6)-threonylcarbamoyltransferase complex dimerization subunit type 1 TsaB [Casimicrobiaceae bacterium]|nr:tRNA (adenosine(37)-N6)-threonylcarbamoyltransferase complex dimerization subunit type 1 TsaB [Casimicrobiaceae bacterium]